MKNMKEFNRIEEVKKEFISFYYGRNAKSFLYKYGFVIKNLGYNENIVTEWSNEYNLEQGQKLIKSLKETVNIRNIIESDVNLAKLSSAISLDYVPSYNVLKQVIEIIKRAKKCRVNNSEDFNGFPNEGTLWDMYFRAENYQVDYRGERCPQCDILNDGKFLNANKIFIHTAPPYPTKQRFTGLLACLFYSRYIDLYEELFSIIIETIKNNFEVSLPLSHFLYTFCKKNDKKRITIVMSLIDTLKNQYPNYNWNAHMIEFYKKNKIDAKNCEYKDMPLEDLLKNN